MKFLATLSIISVAAAAAVNTARSASDVEAVPVGDAPDAKDMDIESAPGGSNDTMSTQACSDTLFTYRGWTGDHCNGHQNIDYEFTRCNQPSLKVDGTHSVSFDNYGECKDIKCKFTELGGSGRDASYHYHQGKCYNINTGWQISRAYCQCLYCNGNNCHT